MCLSFYLALVDEIMSSDGNGICVYLVVARNSKHHSHDNSLHVCNSRRNSENNRDTPSSVTEFNLGIRVRLMICIVLFSMEFVTVRLLFLFLVLQRLTKFQA